MLKRAVGAVARAIDLTLGRLLRTLLTGLIVGYQRFVSPMLGPRCRFYPSCSAYALQAVRVHGAAKGTALATARICRCHPWNPGGVDHVPAKGRWTSEPYVASESHDVPQPTNPAAQAAASRPAPRPDRPADDRSAA
jgi:uncharacterized protein